ncbi:hypothetical protein KXR63_21255 [Stutzerimonas chloritidismutans]|uniref:hypothetical protein n=1 Tax=Stutzerimonas chloritidismutans TaxID=203192 RepID=UPI003F16D94D
MSDDDDLADRVYPIEEDMRQQQRQWVSERIGWIILSLLIIAAVFGLFGIGSLSSAKLASTDGDLKIEYGRFERNGASSQIVIRAKGDAEGHVELKIEGAFFERFSIENIHPQPSTVISYEGGQQMSFNTEPRKFAAIYFSLRPNKTGSSKSTIISGTSRLEMNQFTYP